MCPGIRRFPFRAHATNLPSLLLLFLVPGGQATAQITVATAASVRFAMEDLKADFRKSSGLEAVPVYGSSGTLTAQIRHGAPFDVFVSADMEFPDSLRAWGQASAPPKAYGYGKLVLWTLKDLDLERGLDVLADPGVAAVALADTLRAPYGREAVRALRRSGLYGRVRPKLAFGESISQVSQYILTGSADIGFDARSVVLADEVKGKGYWREVDSALYDRIAQGATVCRYGREHHPEACERFFAYLFSDGARAILSRYGYGLP